MKGVKDRDEQTICVSFDVDIEELENQITPATFDRLTQHHRFPKIRRLSMTAPKIILLLVLVPLALASAARAEQPSGQIEPNAGEWKTWVISSGRDYRVPEPPNPAQTRAELRDLHELISHNTGEIVQHITYWDAGAPAYRWIDLIDARALAGVAITAYPHRVYTYVAQAMYDATV